MPESKMEWGPRAENTPTREAFLRIRHPLGSGHTVPPTACVADFEKWHSEDLPPEIDTKRAASPITCWSLLDFIPGLPAETADIGGYDPADAEFDEISCGREPPKTPPRISGKDGTYTTDRREYARSERVGQDAYDATDPPTDRVRDEIASVRPTAQDLHVFLAHFEETKTTPPELSVQDIALRMNWGDPPWDDKVRLMLSCATAFLRSQGKLIAFQCVGSSVRAVPVGSAIRGKAGRPVTTSEEARFVHECKVNEPNLRWKEIERRWNALHPNKQAKIENLRAAYKRHYSKKGIKCE